MFITLLFHFAIFCTFVCIVILLLEGIFVFHESQKLEILQLEQDNYVGGSWLSR